jgi:hypothetical protein
LSLNRVGGSESLDEKLGKHTDGISMGLVPRGHVVDNASDKLGTPLDVRRHVLRDSKEMRPRIF